MGFEDTFGRNTGGNSDLQYDDTAFLYFFVSLLGAIIIPLIYSLVKPFVFNPVQEKLRDIPNCKSDKLKAQKLIQDNKHKFITQGYKFKVIFTVILIIFAFKCYLRIDTDATQMKKFDPYEILGLDFGADLAAIKKAYRTLSRQYHPDKAKNDPEATAKFIMVGKAYECLTDEKKKATCEKYGNPDGPGKMQVAIAMPSFLLKKENHVAILFVFFFTLLVIIPSVGLSWYKSYGRKDKNGILNENRVGFYQKLNESLIIKNCPLILSLTLEYANIRVQPHQIKDLDRLIKDFDVNDFALKKLPDALRQKFSTPYVLISAHLQGIPIPPSLQEIYFQVLSKAPYILQSMIALTMEHPFFYKRIPQEQRGNFKFFGSDVMLKLMDFQQMIVQGLWVGTPEVFQLSYFRENPSEKRNKKLPNLKELVKAPEEQRKLNFVMDEEAKASVNEELNVLPDLDYEVFCGVEGENEITDHDLLTISVTITRNQYKKKQKIPLVHCPNFPTFKYEKYHFLIATERKDVVHYSLIPAETKTVECKFQLRLPQGRYAFNVYVKSDSYRGFDLEKEMKFEVVDNAKVKRTIEWHKDDEELENQPSFFNQMMAQMNPKDEDSDEEEEEDDEDEKKISKKVLKTKAAANKKVSSSKKDEDWEDEEEEEEEEDK